MASTRGGTSRGRGRGAAGRGGVVGKGSGRGGGSVVGRGSGRGGGLSQPSSSRRVVAAPDGGPIRHAKLPATLQGTKGATNGKEKALSLDGSKRAAVRQEKLPAFDGSKRPLGVHGKQHALRGGGETSGRQELHVGGGTPPGIAKSTGGQASSHSSNPSGQTTPPSQGTPSSQHTTVVSQTRTIPPQYPQTSIRSGSQRRVSPAPSCVPPPILNFNVQQQAHDVEMPEEEAEEDDYEEDEVNAVEDQELYQAELDAAADQEPLGEDYQELLDNIMALPGRENLPLLSEVAIAGKTPLW